MGNGYLNKWLGILGSFEYSLCSNKSNLLVRFIIFTMTEKQKTSQAQRTLSDRQNLITT